MTVQEALSRLELEHKPKKTERVPKNLRENYNRLLAPIAKRSQKIELKTYSLINVLLALIKNTEYSTEVVVCSPHLSLTGRPLLSDVFVFGEDPGRFNVWFENRFSDGKTILCFSLKSFGI